MKKTIVTAALILNFCAISAQPEKPKGFENSSHELISGTNIKLLPASKLSIDPEVPKTETPKITLKFEMPEYVWNTKKLIQTIDPDKIKEKATDSIYMSNYIRLGGGNNTHLIGELYLANKPNAQSAYHFNASHIQANNNDMKQAFGNTKFNLGGARFYRNSSLNLSLFYNRDYVSLFGRDSILKVNQESPAGKIGATNRISQMIGANIDYVSLASGKKPEIKWLNKISNFSTNLNHQELEIASMIKVLKNFKNLSVFGDFEFTNIRSEQRNASMNALSLNNQFFIDVKPRVQFYHKQTSLDVNVGANITYNKNTSLNNSRFLINPFIQLEKGLTGLEMKVYGAIDGGLNKNSIRRMNDVMPFFLDTVSLKNPYEQINGYIGVKGKLAGNSQFSLDFGGNSIADMLTFVSAKGIDDTLKTPYDSIRPLKPYFQNSVSSFYFRAFLQYNMGESFKLSAHIKITQFENGKDYWNIPSLTYNIAAEYLPISSVLIKLGMQGIGKRYNQILKGKTLETVSYSGFNDLYARIDYKFNGKGRIWIQGSNLLNQDYQTWYGYKAFGLTVVGGISLAIF
jgi:hypothetical protein